MASEAVWATYNIYTQRYSKPLNCSGTVLLPFVTAHYTANDYCYNEHLLFSDVPQLTR